MRFSNLSDFDKNLPCDGGKVWKEPEFRKVSFRGSPSSDPEFLDPQTEDPGGAKWAGETTRDRVESGLRSRKIRALLWEPEEEDDQSIWKMFAEWLKK